MSYDSTPEDVTPRGGRGVWTAPCGLLWNGDYHRAVGRLALPDRDVPSSAYISPISITLNQELDKKTSLYYYTCPKPLTEEKTD
ncbi:hypothetical protein FCV25MIE_18834 [Fagus crenata]